MRQAMRRSFLNHYNALQASDQNLESELNSIIDKSLKKNMTKDDREKIQYFMKKMVERDAVAIFIELKYRTDLEFIKTFIKNPFSSSIFINENSMIINKNFMHSLRDYGASKIFRYVVMEEDYKQAYKETEKMIICLENMLSTEMSQEFEKTLITSLKALYRKEFFKTVSNTSFEQIVKICPNATFNYAGLHESRNRQELAKNILKEVMNDILLECTCYSEHMAKTEYLFPFSRYENQEVWREVIESYPVPENLIEVAKLDDMRTKDKLINLTDPVPIDYPHHNEIPKAPAEKRHNHIRH